MRKHDIHVQVDSELDKKIISGWFFCLLDRDIPVGAVTVPKWVFDKIHTLYKFPELDWNQDEGTTLFGAKVVITNDEGMVTLLAWHSDDDTDLILPEEQAFFKEYETQMGG